MERTVTTIPVKNWPRDSDWSTWLKEPILPRNHEITQINLIERVTVTKPDGTEEKQETRHSNRGQDRSIISESYTNGRLNGPEREGIHGSRISSEEMHTERHHEHRRSTGDRYKPLPPLPYERQTTGRITNHHQIQTEEEHTTRSLDSRRQQRSGEMKSRGTSMHGQILLQDGTPAQDSTEFISTKKQETVDLNDNGIGNASGTMTILELEEPIPNGSIHEKEPLESRRLSNSSDDFMNSFKRSDGCCICIPSSLIYAVSVTLACFWCFPIGIYAVHRALQIQSRRRRGDMVGAMKASRAAGFWATVALVWGALIFGTMVLLIWLFSGIF